MNSPRVAPDSPGAVLQLIRSNAVSSRSELAKYLGVSASTASSRVQTLIDHGYLEEAGEGRSHGGRRPRRLALRPDFGYVAAADLGSRHATMAVFDMGGTLVHERTDEVRIATGPQQVLSWVGDEISRAVNVERALLGVTIGVPGPVNMRTGQVVTPSRMPGWHGVSVREELAIFLSDTPVLVDNDANLMAMGEYSADPTDHMVFVKAGTGIGCGVIASGRLHRGGMGAAGDISHLPVPGREDVECACGRNGCLDAVASGAAVVRDLQAAGVDVTSPAGVVDLASDAEPTATRLLREAGRATGEILATVVNFFNPDALVFGGQLSRAEPFVSSVRAVVYERCLSMATDNLHIRTTRAGHLAGVVGGAQLALEHVLDPQRVNEQIEKADASL